MQAIWRCAWLLACRHNLVTEVGSCRGWTYTRNYDRARSKTRRTKRKRLEETSRADLILSSKQGCSSGVAALDNMARISGTGLRKIGPGIAALVHTQAEAEGSLSSNRQSQCRSRAAWLRAELDSHDRRRQREPGRMRVKMRTSGQTDEVSATTRQHQSCQGRNTSWSRSWQEELAGIGCKGHGHASREQKKSSPLEEET